MRNQNGLSPSRETKAVTAKVAFCWFLVGFVSFCLVLFFYDFSLFFSVFSVVRIYSFYSRPAKTNKAGEAGIMCISKRL